MTVFAFGDRVFIFDLAGCVCVVDLVTKGADQLMSAALALQTAEDGGVTLGALLHGQRLYFLVIESRPRRYRSYVRQEINFVGSGIGAGDIAPQTTK